MRYHFPLIIILVIISAWGCAFKSVSRAKHIPYAAQNQDSKISSQQLNVFSPRKQSELNPVLVFIHGGSWRSGRKELYSFFGNRFARKDIVTVVIDYPLGERVNYQDMANASAHAIRWVYENIRSYGGDPEKIYVSGHSAGGHLAALISTDAQYFSTINVSSPIRGTILIDAAGLDMHGYLLKRKLATTHPYIKVFSMDSLEWKKASPIYSVSDKTPPMLILRGGKTYPSIEKGTEKLVEKVKTLPVNFKYVVQHRKKHIPMITQFFWTWNVNYRRIAEFMTIQHLDSK